MYLEVISVSFLLNRPNKVFELYVIIMSCTSFGVNLHSVVFVYELSGCGFESRYCLLKECELEKVFNCVICILSLNNPGYELIQL